MELSKPVVNRVSNTMGLIAGLPQLLQGVPQLIDGNIAEGLPLTLQGLGMLIGFYLVGKGR